MRCPFCFDTHDKVVDSRSGKGGKVIRRRRECIKCGRRFTTYESIEVAPLTIVKKDGRREVFSREKVFAGLQRACEKRKISVNVIEIFVDELEQDLREAGEKEIPAPVIGERVMAFLHGLDEVAYVRFASVYREFKDVNDFFSELKTLLKDQRR